MAYRALSDGSLAREPCHRLEDAAAVELKARKATQTGSPQEHFGFIAAQTGSSELLPSRHALDKIKKVRSLEVAGEELRRLAEKDKPTPSDREKAQLLAYEMFLAGLGRNAA